MLYPYFENCTQTTYFSTRTKNNNNKKIHITQCPRFCAFLNLILCMSYVWVLPSKAKLILFLCFSAVIYFPSCFHFPCYLLHILPHLSFILSVQLCIPMFSELILLQNFGFELCTFGLNNIKYLHWL